MASEVLLVRHASIAFAPPEPVIGVPLDAPLSEGGCLQARALGCLLRECPPVACFASDLPRAAQTAEIAVRGLGISVHCISTTAASASWSLGRESPS